jgi:hypothetical protein
MHGTIPETAEDPLAACARSIWIKLNSESCMKNVLLPVVGPRFVAPVVWLFYRINSYSCLSYYFLDPENADNKKGTIGIYLLSFPVEDQACYKSLRLQTLVLRGKVVDIDKETEEWVLVDRQVAVKTV